MAQKLFTLFFFLVSVQAASAADCTSPNYPEGTMLWLSSPSPGMYFCNGAVWTSMDKGTTNAGGACPAGSLGLVNYINTGTLATTTFRFCDGANWKNMKGSTITGGCGSVLPGQITYSAGINKYTFCAISTLFDVVGGTSCGTTLTAGTSGGTLNWTIPSTWNNSNNTIQVIGPGGSGSPGDGANGGSGGGGGGYSKIANLSLTPPGTIRVKIGAVGGGTLASGHTYFCNSTSNCDSIMASAVQASAFGGTAGTAGVLSPGAPTSSGTIVLRGSIIAAGGDGAIATSSKGAGGGGAGGAEGAGLPGSGQAGGAGGGGSGGAGGTGNAGAGGNDLVGGAGGGGAGAVASNGTGGAGGSYGGGGGGGGRNTGSAGGGGGGGAVIINWSPATGTLCN